MSEKPCFICTVPTSNEKTFGMILCAGCIADLTEDFEEPEEQPQLLLPSFFESCAVHNFQ